MNDTALIVISTGEKYCKYIEQLVESAKKFFVPHEIILFTDSSKTFGVYRQVYNATSGFPNATLMRYHIILTQEEILCKFKYIFYCDVDMQFVDVVGNEIFSSGITAALSPGFVFQEPSLESNTQSTAYTPRVNQYYCGGFNGGTSSAFLEMSRVLRHNIDIDLKNNIIAKHNDESHLNKYLYRNPPTRVLSPSYCYPETNIAYYKHLWNGNKYSPKLIALTKELELNPVLSLARLNAEFDDAVYIVPKEDAIIVEKKDKEKQLKDFGDSLYELLKL